MSELVQATLKIPLDLPDGIDFLSSVSFLQNWVKTNEQLAESGPGYIMKAPYVQHQVSFPIKKFSGVTGILDYIRDIEQSVVVSASSSSQTWRYKSDNVSDTFPYVMLQQNNPFAIKERKVLVANGEAIGFNRSGSQRGATIQDQGKYFLFAEQAIAMLKSRCPHAMVDG